MFLKRILDIVASLFGVLILLPLFIIVSVLIKLDSKGTILFKQVRVTKDGKKFNIYKFRTMQMDSEKEGQLTVGKDNRITKIGSILRRTKLDELPQLFNVLFGDMSLVGPRPEVPKYVSFYTEEQKEILKVRAGITDYASIYFSDENSLLAGQKNPEQFYIDVIMTKKIELNKKYINEISVFTDIKIIFLKIKKILE